MVPDNTGLDLFQFVGMTGPMAEIVNFLLIQTNTMGECQILLCAFVTRS